MSAVRRTTAAGWIPRWLIWVLGIVVGLAALVGIGIAAGVITFGDVQVGTVVVDVRTREEFVAGHVADAINLDIADPAFRTRVGELDPGGEYLVYCRSGTRASEAVRVMRAVGITNVVNAWTLEHALELTGRQLVIGPG